MKAPIVYMHKMADSVAQGDLWDAYEQYKQTMNTPPSGTSLIDMLKKRPYMAAAIGLGGLGLAGGAIYAAKRADKKYDQLWEKERESTDNIHE